MILCLTRRLLIYSLTIVLFFLFSCSSYYWIPINEAGLETGDKVFKVRTLCGDTVNFRSGPRSSAIFNGEEICGIDNCGNELSFGVDELSEIELADWDSGMKYIVYGSLLVLTIYLVVELCSEGPDQAF